MVWWEGWPNQRRKTHSQLHHHYLRSFRSLHSKLPAIHWCTQPIDKNDSLLTIFRFTSSVVVPNWRLWYERRLFHRRFLHNRPRCQFVLQAPRFSWIFHRQRSVLLHRSACRWCSYVEIHLSIVDILFILSYVEEDQILFIGQRNCINSVQVLRGQRLTVTPSLRQLWAVAKPMPLVPPVTTAICPFKDIAVYIQLKSKEETMTRYDDTNCVLEKIDKFNFCKIFLFEIIKVHHTESKEFRSN